MSKSEILKNHVLTTAKGLNTSDLAKVIKELNALAKEKTKEVLGSISTEDRLKLVELYEIACEYGSTECNMEVAIKAEVTGDNVEDCIDCKQIQPELQIYIKSNNGIWLSTLDSIDVIQGMALLEKPAIADLMEASRQRMKDFLDFLDVLSEKYKMNKETLMCKIIYESE